MSDKPHRVFSDKKRKTYLRMFRSIIFAFIVIIIVLIVLQLLGINVGSMLAGVGIASIVIGFALQDAMKDIFRGLEIVSDNYYDIGDVIKYGDNMGQVISINLRTTKIQDFNTMNIVSIANRNINEVEVVSGYIYLIIPMPLRLKPKISSQLVEEILMDIRQNGDIISAENQGVTEITSSALNYQIQILTDPTKKLTVRRFCLTTAATTLARFKVPLPFTEINLHGAK